MNPRILLTLSLGATIACGPSVALPGSGDGSTGGDGPPGGSTTASTTSSIPPNPTAPTNPDPPPQTSTDPFDPTSGGLDDTGSSGDTSCGFLCETTGDITPECDVFEQNCPDGEKCTPWANDGGSSWNATRCAPIVDDPDQPGEACVVEGSPASGIDSCDLGSMCWNVDTDTGTGTCISHCMGAPNAPTCADANTICSINGDGVLALCLPTCDPLLFVDACPNDEVCTPYNSTFFCTPDGSAEGGAAFDACEFVNACDPGNVCINPAAAQACDPGGTGCCLPWCDLSAPDCPGDTTCFPWFEEGGVPPGGELIGVCAEAP